MRLKRTVAGIIEDIRLVDASRPHPDAILIPIAGCMEEAFVCLGCGSRQEVVTGNPV